jgi:hypothetical protein
MRTDTIEYPILIRIRYTYFTILEVSILHKLKDYQTCFGNHVTSLHEKYNMSQKEMQRSKSNNGCQAVNETLLWPFKKKKKTLL